MVEIHGCVSAGGHTRRQVSHPKNVSIKKLMISLRNLLKLIELANTIDDTAAVIKKFSSPADEGGMHMVGELLAHEIINVLTKIGIICNCAHFRNPSVSKGTKTEKRL